MKNNTCSDYIFDLLSSLGGVRMRAMFGGYGVYKDGIFFAVIIDGTLYFKVNKHNQCDYESYGSKPFSYKRKDKKRVAMSYWQVPGQVLEDNTLLMIWAKKAIYAAVMAKGKGQNTPV